MQCNANCVFCSSKVRAKEFSGLPELMTIDDGFEYTLKRLASRHVLRYELTGGGEPYLNNMLSQIVKRIKDEVPKSHIKLYTNGHILSLLEGLDELNISVAHWDLATNNKYFRIRSAMDILTILSFFSPERQYRLRLSVPMIRGAIDSREKADQFIAITSQYVDGYVFRPMFPFTPNRAKYDGELAYCDPRVEIDSGHAFIATFFFG